MGNDNSQLLAQARRGVGRAAEELDQAAEDLSRPWPRVAPDVLAEGRAAVDRVGAALRELAQRLDDNSQH